VDIAITREPPASPPRELHPQLIYTLDRWDYVACWMCQWDRAHPSGSPPFTPWLLRLPLRLLMGLRGKGQSWFSADWLFRVLVPLLVLPVMLSLWHTAVILHDPNSGILVACGTAALLLLWLLLLWRPGPLPEWDNPQRARHLRLMRAKAVELQATGMVINRERIHWFLVFPEGFQEVSELRRKSAEGIEQYDFRVRSAPWGQLREVVVREGHVFLVGPGEDVWIIPKRCFADVTAVADFLDVVRSCCRAVTHSRIGAIAPVVENPEAIRAGDPSR
jgi:hypothetical protein